MATEKLSISLESSLAATVRAAAQEAAVSISTWIAEAAQAKARQHQLREALDAFADQHGSVSDDEIERLIADARKASVVTRPRPDAA